MEKVTMKEEMTEAREDAIYRYQDEHKAEEKMRAADIEAEYKGDLEREEG